MLLSSSTGRQLHLRTLAMLYPSTSQLLALKLHNYCKTIIENTTNVPYVCTSHFIFLNIIKIDTQESRFSKISNLLLNNLHTMVRKLKYMCQALKVAEAFCQPAGTASHRRVGTRTQQQLEPRPRGLPSSLWQSVHRHFRSASGEPGQHFRVVRGDRSSASACSLQFVRHGVGIAQP